jgi:dihydrolipoamide dehydrogenase
LSVALVEKDKVGGTCLHRGCIPAKELLETAHVFRTVSEASTFGVNAGEPAIDWTVTMARKQQVVDTQWKGLEATLKGRKITIVPGTGRFRGNGVVEVDGPDGTTTLNGTNVVLAAGSVPRTIPGFDVDGKFVLTSDEVLSMPDLPRTAAVIGGGAIGCEFASTLADVGVKVTVLEGLPKILPGCDSDVANAVLRSFKKRGIDVRTGVKITGHQPGDSTTMVQIEGAEPLEVERVIVSVGRRPLSETLGLEGTGVEVDERGFVKVGETCRTTVAGVWAVGDLIATPQLAHVGFAEAIVAIRTILGEEVTPIEYDKVPWGIYCHPEVAWAGLTEEQARARGHEVVKSVHRFGGNSRALIVGEPDGFVKIVADATNTILGVHVVGPWATEIVAEGYLAVNWEATADDVGRLVHAHPTLSELFGESALALTGRGIHG